LTRSVYSTLTLCLAHFADLQQWVDQDEQNEAPEDDYMNNFGGGGMGEDGGFGGIDFSKLGGAAAGGEGGMPGMEGLGAGDDDEEEGMPELEDEEGEGEEEEEAASTSKGKEKAAAPKIEEVS
jgi:hypothetical protein